MITETENIYADVLDRGTENQLLMIMFDMPTDGNQIKFILSREEANDLLEGLQESFARAKLSELKSPESIDKQTLGITIESIDDETLFEIQILSMACSITEEQAIELVKALKLIKELKYF